MTLQLRPSVWASLLAAVCLSTALPSPAAPAADGHDHERGAEDIGPLLPSAGPDDRTGAADDLAELLKDLSPEEVNQLVRSAVKDRLEVERQQVAEEIRQDLLSDPDEVDRAVKVLQEKPKDTQADNIERILKAFAIVDLRIGKAARLLAAGKHAEAAAALEKALNVQEASYRNAARYTLYARAMEGAGKGYEAVDAYQKILVVMPDRISFAADAAMQSARIYEKLNRFTYAAEMYSYAVGNYGLTLDKEALDLIDKKVAEYEQFGQDALGWAARTMGEVRDRLRRLDSGKATQEKEDRIIAVITDLIKTAEEKQKAQNNSQRQRRQQGACKKCGRQGCDGQCQGSASASGRQPPKGTNAPSNPAKVSALVPGAVARPTKRSEVHKSSEVGDWANLPPRERRKLHQLRRKVMSERYRDIISKYRTKISETSGGR